MMHLRNKHASNDPRGEDTNPAEPEMEFKPWLFKNIEIQKTWLSNSKKGQSSRVKNLRGASLSNTIKKMLAPMEVLG